MQLMIFRTSQQFKVMVFAPFVEVNKLRESLSCVRLV